MSNPSCHLKVVLLCSGNGADANSYRPKRDESQWWNRRDALVRCVASFLFGPRSGGKKKGDNPRELIFLYDGDHARLHMTLEEKEGTADSVVPNEHVIIAIWKEAVTRALKAVASSSQDPPVIRKGNLACWAVISPLQASTKKQDGKSSLINPKMIQNWDKRTLLEYLQRECSMEFLREHGLNSATNVILRKTNRAALGKLFQKWSEQQTSSLSKQSKSTVKKEGKSVHNNMEVIFQDILSSFPASQHNNLIAATLHESSDCELPCFGDLDISNLDDTKKQVNLCLFLGAVRDMIPQEYRTLEKVCHRIKSHGKCIPLTKVRLGWVPEFTSKILSIAAFHHAQRRLGPAMQELVSPKQQTTENSHKRSLSSEVVSDTSSSQQQSTSLTTRTPQLHIISLLPLRSDQLVLDLEQRNRSLWCLVRVLVCSLWRSRVAGSRSTSFRNAPKTPLQNTLSLVFLDGLHLTLQQDEWVSALAEQHQAAPSEFQVLKALIDLVNKNKSTDAGEKLTSTIGSAWQKRTPEILQDIMEQSPNNKSETHKDVLPRYLVSIERGAATYLTRQFYQTPSEGVAGNINDMATVRKDIWALLSVGSDNTTSGPDDVEAVLSEAHNSFLRTFENDPSWHVTRQSVVDTNTTEVSGGSCMDWEASSITALQHFIYQERLYIDCGVYKDTTNKSESHKAEKRKKKRKEKKKKKFKSGR